MDINVTDLTHAETDNNVVEYLIPKEHMARAVQIACSVLDLHPHPPYRPLTPLEKREAKVKQRDFPWRDV